VADTHSSRAQMLDSNSGVSQEERSVGGVDDITVAICVSVKSENPYDLAEWVQYYRCTPAAA
jgi:hypothetical protein